jgi:hypothetical protein
VYQALSKDRFRVARDSPAVSPGQNDREGKLKVVLMIAGQDVLDVGPESTQELQTGDPLTQAPPLALAHLDLGAISISYDQHVPAAHIGANLLHTL